VAIVCQIIQIVHFILKPSVEFEYTITCYDYGLNSSIILCIDHSYDRNTIIIV